MDLVMLRECCLGLTVLDDRVLDNPSCSCWEDLCLNPGAPICPRCATTGRLFPLADYVRKMSRGRVLVAVDSELVAGLGLKGPGTLGHGLADVVHLAKAKVNHDRTTGSGGL